VEIRPLRASELEEAFALDADAFHQPLERKEAFVRFVDPDTVVGIFEGGRLAAMTGAIPFAQFFGGRPVSMAGISSVAVAPHRRGRGYARRAVEAALLRVRERGEALATLWPATLSLYRKLGFEVAGAQAIRTLAPSALRALPRPERDATRPAEEGDDAALRACYARAARETNGFLDRPDAWWRRLRDRWRERAVYVQDDGAGGVDGYVVYRQLDGEYSALGGGFQIAVDELVAPERDAALALWRLLGSWSSQAEKLTVRGPVEDPLLLLLPEPASTPLVDMRFMLRAMDPARAVAERGFPPGVEIRAPLRLHDRELPENDGDYVLHVAKGRGRLERGGSGGPELDAGAFASLYAGFAGAAWLRGAGRLRGGAVEDAASLEAAFRGPVPWCQDEF